MSFKFKRSAAVLASAAAFSMMATPVMARDWGWGGGRYGHHRDRGVDGGDILAGLLIFGTIAAVASAASKSSKDKRTQDEYRYPETPSQRDRSAGYGEDSRPQWQEGSGINGAINRCMDEIDRGQTRVDSVDAVNREGEGWRVQGRVKGGSNFTCAIDGEGRIRQVSIDGRAL